MTTECNEMVMPVAPIGYGYGGNNGGFGNWGNDIWVILLVLFAFGGWGGMGMGGFGGFGGMMGGVDFPWLLAANANTQNATQDGFNQLATNNAVNSLQTTVMNGFSDTQLGIAGLNQSICNSTGQVVQAVSNGFSQAEISNNARQMANMQQSFANQTAMNAGFNSLQSQFAKCCCDDQLATAQTQNLIRSESFANQLAVSNGVQRILDTMCQDKIDAKNERIAELERQLTMANLAASQTAQTARILADNTAQTIALEQYLNPAPIPAYVVANPNGCGCYNNWNAYNTGCGFNTGCGCSAS